jgi:hypothetical protein
MSKISPCMPPNAARPAKDREDRRPRPSRALTPAEIGAAQKLCRSDDSHTESTSRDFMNVAEVHGGKSASRPREGGYRRRRSDRAAAAAAGIRE